MKVTLYYFQKDLYAFTTNKDYVEKFDTQRCLQVFHKKEIKMKEKEYRKCMAFNSKKMLIEVPLETTQNVILNLVVTYQEDDKVSEYISNLQREAFDMKLKMLNFKFSDTLKSEFLNMLNPDYKGEFDLDVYEIFMSLFKFTFIKNETAYHNLIAETII